MLRIEHHHVEDLLAKVQILKTNHEKTPDRAIEENSEGNFNPACNLQKYLDCFESQGRTMILLLIERTKDTWNQEQYVILEGTVFL